MQTKHTRKVKRGSGKRLIGFWAFYGVDDDIIQWWEGLEPWKGSEIVRNLIRAHGLGKPLADNDTLVLLLEMVRMQITASEGRLTEQMKHIQVVGIGQADAQRLISEEEVQRRERNMKATKW